MPNIAEAILLGIYAPIVVLSALASGLLMRYLWRGWRAGVLDLRHHAIGFSAVFALSAHLVENSYYGFARWADLDGLMNNFPVIATWKLLILCSAISALTVLVHPAVELLHGENEMRWVLVRVTTLALVLWIGATLTALLFVV